MDKNIFFLPPPPSTQLLNDPKSKGSFKNNIFTRHLKDQLWHTDFTYVLNNIGSLKAPFHGLHTVMPLAGGQSGLVHPEFGSSINPFPTRGVGGRLYPPLYCLLTRIWKPDGISGLYTKKQHELILVFAPYLQYRAIVVGKTGKTSVLPWFCWMIRTKRWQWYDAM